MSLEQPKSPMFEMLGKEVDQRQEMVAGLGSYSKELESKFIEIFKARAIPNSAVRATELGTGMMSDKKSYILVEQKIGTGAKVSSAINISKYGTQDLQIERRHFEQGLVGTGVKIAKKGGMVVLGINVVLLGLILLIVGVGLFVIPVGIVMIIIGLFQKDNSPDLTSEQQNASALLRQAVDASLQEAVQIIKSTKL